MRYVIVSEKGPTSYGAYIPDLLEYVTVGETLREVRTLIHKVAAGRASLQRM